MSGQNRRSATRVTMRPGDFSLAVGIMIDTIERVLMELGVTTYHIRKVQEEMTYFRIQQKLDEEAEEARQSHLENLCKQYLNGEPL